MTTKKTFFAIVLILGAILTSCYWRNWETLHPVAPPVVTCTIPTVVSYSADIAQIMNASCGLNNSACHHGSSSSSGIDLTTWSGVSGQATDTTSSPMYLSITWSAPYTSSGMPQTGNKLSSCDISKVLKWSQQGCPNN